MANLKKYLLPIPSKAEQIGIGNALADADALITSLEKLIVKKRAIKVATMQQLLTGKKRLPDFARHPNGKAKGTQHTELGRIPEDWKLVRLGEVAEFSKGKGLPKSHIEAGGKFDCIHYGELFTHYGEVIAAITSKTNLVDHVVVSRRNDVLMPTSDVTPNGLATASSLKKDGVILGGDILIIRASEEQLDSSFFSHLISIAQDQVMQLVTGTTVYHLYGSDMANFGFAMPSNVVEQVEIASVLADMEMEILTLEKRLEKTQQIKQGMMQELLTGRTRLV